MDMNMDIGNQMVEAKRERAKSLLFVCLETVYNMELDEQGGRIELDIPECPLNEKVLKALENTIREFRELYMT